MGIKQANRIEETLSRARQDGNLLEAFFTARVSTAARAEPLFVTNLKWSKTTRATPSSRRANTPRNERIHQENGRTTDVPLRAAE